MDNLKKYIYFTVMAETALVHCMFLGLDAGTAIAAIIGTLIGCEVAFSMKDQKPK